MPRYNRVLEVALGVVLFSACSSCTPLNGQSVFSFDAQNFLSKCRNYPTNTTGSPSPEEWDELNRVVEGRLLKVVPSAKFCHDLSKDGCNEFSWRDSTFRSRIPGAMDIVGWEQDYLSDPPSLCLRNGTSCGQGNVPVLAINATRPEHIQAGVKFAARHNLRVAIKASGHDFLGRSTAKNSLLLWTRNLRDISFTDSFMIGKENKGSAVTVGSGVPLNELYLAAKMHGKFYVGGTAASVAVAGGFVQGGGHSAFSPMFGLASDNTLQFTVVLANGELVTANEIENPDLFWALRGGGAGSWGVVISATFRTFPIFLATEHTAIFLTGNDERTGSFMELHARRIFDMDVTRAGQYFTIGPVNLDTNFAFITTIFANTYKSEAMSVLRSFMTEAKLQGFEILSENARIGLANDIVYKEKDFLGENVILGSRLIPADVYKNNAKGIGEAYTKLLNKRYATILGHLVAGGKVSENRNVNSSLNDKWRSAKTHVVVATTWEDSFGVDAIKGIKGDMTNNAVPVLAALTGQEASGAYSNEADVKEPNFQSTFFGENYERLKEIKKAYDPNGLFIVEAGVGSEDWDRSGFCRV